MSNILRQLTEVTPKEPCVHCGKGDWCYRFANGATVCNRENIAQGWEDSGKKDKNGAAILYPQEWGKKQPDPKVVNETEWIYKDRRGEDLVKVIRQDLDNGKKKIFQNFWNGKRWLKSRPAIITRADIPIYKREDIGLAIMRGETIYLCEGEKCADKLWELGLAATCNIQGAKSFNRSDLQDLDYAERVVLIPDRDRPGLELMKQWEAGLKQAGIKTDWLYPYPESNWGDIPPDNGLDIFDWIKDSDLTKDELLNWIGKKPRRESLKVTTTTPLAEPNAWEPGEDTGAEKSGGTERPQDPDYPWHCNAVEEIFRSRQIAAIDGDIYEWTGTHYEKCDPASILSEFHQWAACTPVYDPKTQREKYSLLTPRFLGTCMDWLKISKVVSAERLNPPGINLKNGVLRFEFKGKQATWTLTPHNPADIYTYCSEVEFNPDADPTPARKLLEALDPEPRTVFLRTVAAALDLKAVRKIVGRGVKAALLWGNGNNGKDSLKDAITLIFGRAQMASATLSDFVSYDHGRKFDLAQLRGKKFNWPSENNQKTALDRSDSLNCAISGEELVWEVKNQQGEPFHPQCVHFFNCNQAPTLKAGLESLSSRICVIHFYKTFTPKPDPRKGELQADPRFKYDPEWVIQSVCPALINEVLAQLNPLLNEGIDYDPLDGAFEDLQEDSTHLWEFCNDLGIKFDPNGRIYVHDLWYQLQAWYEQNGTLERVDKPDGGFKNVWHDQANKWDANITGPNQILKRFKVLFPRIEKKMETVDPNFKNRAYIFGLTINSASPGSPSLNSGVSASPPGSLWLTNTLSASPNGNGNSEAKSEAKTIFSEAESPIIPSGEAGEAKKQQTPTPKKLQEKLVGEEITEYIGLIQDLKAVLGWDSQTLTQYALEKVGKSKINHLTMGEATRLSELLTLEIANHAQN